MTRKQWFLVLLAGLAGALILLAPLPPGAARPHNRTFRIEARQFAYSPGVIQVNPGDTVTIELVSMDVVHGLYVDGYGVSVTADPGQTSRLTFTADRPGSFRFRCSITCGALHPFMIGKLQVGLNAWLLRAIALALLAALTVLAMRPAKVKAKAG